MYVQEMDVPVSELRASLRSWVERARAGEDVVITDRGLPVARLVGLSASDHLERLTAEGLVSRPLATRRKASTIRRVRATGPVGDLVAELRR